MRSASSSRRVLSKAFMAPREPKSCYFEGAFRLRNLSRWVKISRYARNDMVKVLEVTATSSKPRALSGTPIEGLGKKLGVRWKRLWPIDARRLFLSLSTPRNARKAVDASLHANPGNLVIHFEKNSLRSRTLRRNPFRIFGS